MLVSCDNGFHNIMNGSEFHRKLPFNNSVIISRLSLLMKTSIKTFRKSTETFRCDTYTVNSIVDLCDNFEDPWLVEFMTYDREPLQILRAALHACIRRSKKAYVFNLNTCNITCVEYFGDIVSDIYSAYMKKPRQMTDEEFMIYNDV